MAQAKVEENLEKAPMKLAEMLKEGVEFLKKKFASESAELGEHLSNLEKVMDSFINKREEELQRQRDLYDNLMEKHKKLLEYLVDLYGKSEETEGRLTELEDLAASSRAKMIEDLDIKLASKEEATETQEELLTTEEV